MADQVPYCGAPPLPGGAGWNLDPALLALLLAGLALAWGPARRGGDRRALLAGFREGRLSKLATGRVLNEGVDLPDANVAIVASGSSATREYIQRLGRILRPKAETAVLYENITRGTSEGKVARRRRPATT